MATLVTSHQIFINTFWWMAGNVSRGGVEASEGRESPIMNRSPTLVVRRYNVYGFCVGLDHCHKTESESLLLLKCS